MYKTIAGTFRLGVVRLGEPVSDLPAVDAALRQQFRVRKPSILYDDAYGIWTDEDQASAAATAFALFDTEEKRR